MNLDTILADAIDKMASDVHLVAGIPPTMRINGEICPMNYDIFSAEQTKKFIYNQLKDQQIKKFEQEKELNVSFSLKDLAHFRMNVYYHKDNVGAAIRIIPVEIRSLKELGLPHIIAELTRLKSGLILITGPAGMGKTTTMTAMIDLINRDERRYRIITIEDPVEYVHEFKNSIIIQREVNRDTHSFSEGLRQALRQDPNVICIGEMRDSETINIAITAAETGHLVFATMHSADAISAVDRIINAYPKGQQEFARSQLSVVLQGVITQRLLPRISQGERVLALEILTATSAVRNIINTGNIKNLDTAIATSSDRGMISLDKSLADLYGKGIIAYDTALAHAKDIKEFKSLAKV